MDVEITFSIVEAESIKIELEILIAEIENKKVFELTPTVLQFLELLKRNLKQL